MGNGENGSHDNGDTHVETENGKGDNADNTDDDATHVETKNGKGESSENGDSEKKMVCLEKCRRCSRVFETCLFLVYLSVCSIDDRRRIKIVTASGK